MKVWKNVFQTYYNFSLSLGTPFVLLHHDYLITAGLPILGCRVPHLKENSSFKLYCPDLEDRLNRDQLTAQLVLLNTTIGNHSCVANIESKSAPYLGGDQ